MGSLKAVKNVMMAIKCPQMRALHNVRTLDAEMESFKSQSKTVTWAMPTVMRPVVNVARRAWLPGVGTTLLIPVRNVTTAIK